MQVAPTQLVNPYSLQSTSDAQYRTLQNINKAHLGSENDLTRALDFGGNLAISIGSRLVGDSVNKELQGLNDKLSAGQITQKQFNNKSNLLNGLGIADSLTNSFTPTSSPFGQLGNTVGSMFGNFFALGSSPANTIRGEAEGGELVEHPNGIMQEIKGPSHEEGGVPIEMNPLSHIYSKRIKVDGVSIADRHKKRIKRSVYLEDLMSRDPYNTMLIKSWERGKHNNMRLKKLEQELQTIISNYIR